MTPAEAESIVRLELDALGDEHVWRASYFTWHGNTKRARPPHLVKLHLFGRVSNFPARGFNVQGRSKCSKVELVGTITWARAAHFIEPPGIPFCHHCLRKAAHKLEDSARKRNTLARILGSSV